MKTIPVLLLFLSMIVILTINCKAKSVLDKPTGEEDKGKTQLNYIGKKDQKQFFYSILFYLIKLNIIKLSIR